MDFTIIIDSLPSLLKATLMTILLAGISIVIALLIGFITAIVRIIKVKFLHKVAGLYVSVIRGTPLLVQIFVIYYGLPQNRNFVRSNFFRYRRPKLKCRCLSL